MKTPNRKTSEERIGSAFEKIHKSVLDKTEEELGQDIHRAPTKIYFLVWGGILALTFGMVAYAWGTTTRIRTEFQGIAYRPSRNMCGAYSLVRWMAPINQRLAKPSQWQLLAAEVKHDQIPTLTTSQGSCRADQTAECCALVGLPVTGLPPRDLWNKPSWELPKKYQ